MGAEPRYTVFPTTYDENLSPTAGKLGKDTETPAERIKKMESQKESALTELPEQQEGCTRGEQPGHLCRGQAAAAGPCCLNHTGSDAEWLQNCTMLPCSCFAFMTTTAQKRRSVGKYLPRSFEKICILPKKSPSQVPLGRRRGTFIFWAAL